MRETVRGENMFAVSSGAGAGSGSVFDVTLCSAIGVGDGGFDDAAEEIVDAGLDSRGAFSNILSYSSSSASM